MNTIESITDSRADRNAFYNKLSEAGRRVSVASKLASMGAGSLNASGHNKSLGDAARIAGDMAADYEILKGISARQANGLSDEDYTEAANIFIDWNVI